MENGKLNLSTLYPLLALPYALNFISILLLLAYLNQLSLLDLINKANRR